MAKVDRSILQANDQNMGDFGDPNKLESSISHLADKIDENDTGFNSHKNAAELAHPDKSVTEKKLADYAVSRRTIQPGSVGVTELDTSILSQPSTMTGAQAKFQMVDEQFSPKNSQDGAVITIIDDDGYSQFLNQWKLVCDKKGIKCTVAVYKNKVGQSGAMTVAQLQSLKAQGYEVVSHSVSHPNINTVSEATWNIECAESKDFIISNNLGNGEVMVYPEGFTSSTAEQKSMIKRVTRKHYKYGVNALGGINLLPVDSFEVNRQGMSSTYEAIKGYIDEAIQKKAWLIFLTHSQNNWNQALMEQWIDYAQSLNVPILPFSEAEKLVGNALSYGDDTTSNYFFASKNGAFKFNDNVQPENFTMNMSIENYAQNKTTISNLSNTQDTFLSTGGVLHTYRGGTWQSYQIYMPVGREQIFKRSWVDTTKVWGDWLLMSGTVSKTNSDNPMNNGITSYQRNAETIVPINAANDTFRNAGGVMKVFRYTSDVYTYATFVPVNENAMYMRKWTGSAWTAWTKLTV